MRRELNRVTPDAEPQALTEKEFAALMARMSAPAQSGLAIAVSGGPDSMALAFCLRRWCQTTGRALRAFLVDHRLRDESAQEAATVKDRLQSLGITTDILVWEHEVITSKMHQVARDARYALLTDACHAAGIHDLFLAHHGDDQAETVLMRLAKGSGIDGLAGMRKRQQRGSITLWRPFLEIPKVRLIATCAAHALPYVTDPSNEAERFARGRLRQVMPLLADEGMEAERLCDLARRAGDASDALRFFTEAFLRTHSQRDTMGALWLDRQALVAQPPAIIMRVLAACLHHIHPTPYAPDDAPLRGLADSVLRETALPAFTLNGCLTYGTEQHIIMLRELSAITDTPMITSGQIVDWDQRLRIAVTGTSDATAWQIKALGTQEHAVTDALLPGFRKQVPQGRIRATWPALWQKGKPVLIPIPEQEKIDAEQQVSIEFLRSWPLRLTDAVEN